MPEKATKDGYEAQLQTNHLSHFLLSSLLLPDLEKAAATSGEARIVNHSSIARHGAPLAGAYFEKLAAGALPEELAGDESQARGKRYHQSKLANVVFTLALKVLPCSAVPTHIPSLMVTCQVRCDRHVLRAGQIGSQGLQDQGPCCPSRRLRH